MSKFKKIDLRMDAGNITIQAADLEEAEKLLIEALNSHPKIEVDWIDTIEISSSEM